MDTLNQNILAIRKEKRLSQAKMAEKMFIERSAYCKLETGATQLTIGRLSQIADIFNLSLIELLYYHKRKKGNEPVTYEKLEAIENEITDKDKIIEIKEEKLQLYKDSVLSLLLTKYMEATMDYQEPVPYEDLSENDLHYLNICGIKSKEDYEAYDILIGRTFDDKEQEAFEEMIDNMDIYRFFEFGLVDEPFLTRHWDVFNSKAKPKFIFDQNGCRRIEEVCSEIEPPF